MAVDVFTREILARASGRYIASVGSEEDKAFLQLAAEGVNGAVCRLQRSDNARWRTILVADAPYSEAAIQSAYSWAANVRERLPGTQSADLYMLIVMRDVPFEEAVKIETDDNFCRKYVLGPDESIDNFFDRTFLGPVKAQSDGGPLQNPVVTALQSVVKNHAWVGAVIEQWEQVLVNSDAHELTKFLMLRAAEDHAND